MTANQVQIRRDSSTNLNAAVPALAELGYDTTNNRLRIGDGTTSGGISLPNSFDTQKQTFLSGDASGTNTITMTVSPTPAAYAKYQRFVFKAAATNTGAATINVNSLGAKTVKKRTASGVADLEGGEIIQDGVYAVVYDGTYMQLESDVSAQSGGAWELLATATASSSATLDFTGVFTSDYIQFKFVCEEIVLSDPVRYVFIQTSNNGGSSYTSTATAYGWANFDISISAASPSETGVFDYQDTGIRILGTSAALGYNSADIFVLNSLSSSLQTYLYGNAFMQSSAGAVITRRFSARRSANEVNDAFRFIPSSGNFTSGTIYLYGLKNT